MQILCQDKTPLWPYPLKKERKKQDAPTNACSTKEADFRNVCVSAADFVCTCF